MKQLFIGLALLVSLSPCHARIGESLDQCIARYGKTVEVTDTIPQVVQFSKNGVNIGVIIVRGVVDVEMFQKIDKSAFTADEKGLLMAADSAGQHWTLMTTFGAKEVFARDDGTKCIYRASDNSLMMYSKEYIAAASAKQKANLDATFKNF